MENHETGCVAGDRRTGPTHHVTTHHVSQLFIQVLATFTCICTHRALLTIAPVPPLPPPPEPRSRVENSTNAFDACSPVLGLVYCQVFVARRKQSDELSVSAAGLVESQCNSRLCSSDSRQQEELTLRDGCTRNESILVYLAAPSATAGAFLNRRRVELVNRPQGVVVVASFPSCISSDFKCFTEASRSASIVLLYHRWLK